MKHTDDYGNQYWLNDKGCIILCLAEFPYYGKRVRNLGPVKKGIWVVKRSVADMYKKQLYSLAYYVIKYPDLFGIDLMNCVFEKPDKTTMAFTITPGEWLELGKFRHMAHLKYEPQADVSLYALEQYVKQL